MKTNAIVRIVLFSLTTLLLLGILGAGLGIGLFVTNIRSETSRQEQIHIPGRDDPTSPTTGESDSGNAISDTAFTVDPGKIREIEIDWVSGTITVQAGDVENITFSESAVSDSRYAMVWKQEGDTLSIEYCKETIHINFGITINSDWNKDLVITVPRDWVCQSLEIDTASSDVDITGLTIQEMEVDAASAECNLVDCMVDSLDVDTASGDVEFTGTLNTLDFDAASASFTGKLTNTPRRMTLDSMSGDLDITLPADSGFSVKVDGVSSRFSSEFPTLMQNGRHLCGDGSCQITVSAVSGDVTIRKGS